VRIARHADEEEAGLGLAPLIDVVLLLLIFFLVTSSFAKPEVPLDLPPAETGEAPTPSSLVVTLTEDGALRIDDRPASPAELGERLASAAGPETDLLLRADEAVPHGRVVEVLDLARRHAVSKIAIAVAPGAAPAARAAPSGS